MVPSHIWRACLRSCWRGSSPGAGAWASGGWRRWMSSAVPNPAASELRQGVPIQLHYFPVQGSAEPIRLSLAYLSVDWTEAELNLLDFIDNLDRFPFCQCPSISIGKEFNIAQDRVVLRYLGRKLDLYGKSPEESAKVDMVLEAVENLRDRFKHICKVETPHFTCSLQERLRYDTSVLNPESSPTASMAFRHLEKYLESSKSDKPLFVGGQVSIADFAVFNLFDLHSTMFRKSMHRFPNIVRHHEYIKSLPSIKSYLAGPKRHPNIWVVDWLATERKDMDIHMFMKMAPGIVESM
eukprot:evm.model.scf_1907.4 EVM.evm.TU.scf_1907.4   scf_1907:16848-19417(-)